MAGADSGVHSSTSRRLQSVSVQAHSGFAHTSTVFLDAIHIVQHREGSLANKWLCKCLHHVWRTHTNHSACLVVQHIVNVDLAFNDGSAWVNRLSQGIKRIAQNLRLDLLDVVGDVKDRTSFQWGSMRLWVTWESHEWDIRRWQVTHNLVARTHCANLAQLRDAITVIVNASVNLAVQDALLHRVGALCWELLVVQRMASNCLFVVIQVR